MSLKQKFGAPRPPRKTAFERRLENLTEEDLKAFHQVLGDPTWSNLAIMRVLLDEGIAVSKDTIGHYRKAHLGAL